MACCRRGSSFTSAPTASTPLNSSSFVRSSSSVASDPGRIKVQAYMGVRRVMVLKWQVRTLNINGQIGLGMSASPGRQCVPWEVGKTRRRGGGAGLQIMNE